MPLPLILKAAILGGAAYAASRWYASKRRSAASNIAHYDAPSTLSDVSSPPAQQAPWPSSEPVSRPGL